jgi:eukaryotic-like serine/threonine-protein kinase
MALEAGTRLGPYRIAGPLGKGGMGEVYRADDDRLGRAVAVKVLPGEFSADPQRRRRFEREARAIAALNHPNICAIHDIGHQDDVDYLVMELLDGESLADRLRRGALPFAEASPIAMSVVETLAAVHERGLIHRDLKPANIFLTRHGVKLLDFGLAREAQRTDGIDTGVTQQGIVMGTPKYLAPEQLRGDPVDHRADLFAAAAVIVEMLTGRAAFEAPSLVDILHAITHEDPAPLPPGVAPPHFERALRQALAKRPADRPASAAAFAMALRHTSDSATVPVALGTTTDRVGLTRLLVLPFRMLRPDPDTDFLAFSLPDAVSAALAGVESVVVRATMSAAAAAGGSPDLAALARHAQVDAVVTGTLLRAGGEVRLSAQLVAVPDGSLLWAHTIQAPVHDLFQLQDALTHAIVSALHVPLSTRDRRALKQDVPASGAAYELFLRANKLASDSSHWLEVRQLYEQAVGIDPGYAPAWARLGRVLRVLAKYGGPAARDDRARAERAFERARALNPDLATAHYLYAHLEAESGRAEDAMTRLLGRARSRRADPELLAGLVTTCRYCGLLDESIAAYEHVSRLDPATRTSVAYTYYMRGDYEQTVATDSTSMPFAATLARVRTGDLEGAMPVLRQLERDSPHEGVRVISAAYRFAIRGDADALISSVQKIDESGFSDPEGYFLLAPFLARSGALAIALTTLERAVTCGYHCPWSLDRDPYWEPIRATPQFARLRSASGDASGRARAAFDAAGGPALVSSTS